MKFPCTLKNALLIIRYRFGLFFASKGLGYLVALLLLLSLLSHYKLSCYQTSLLLTMLALADITLLKTTCHFLPLLIGFDTLTYRKELQLIPYTCGSLGKCGLQVQSYVQYLPWESCGEDETELFIRVARLILTHGRACLIISDRWRIHKNSSLI